MSMIAIKFYGSLAEQFGESFSFDVKTTSEMIRALSTQIENFTSSIRDGEFRLLRDDYAMDEEELMLSIPEDATLHLVPMPVGSKKGGLMKILLGVALIGVGWAMSAGAAAGSFAATMSKNLIILGAGAVLQGIGQMLSPSPGGKDSESANKRQSYVFGGPVNVTEEGNIIPVAYGTTWCGSLVLSAGMDVLEVI